MSSSEDSEHRLALTNSGGVAAGAFVLVAAVAVAAVVARRRRAAANANVDPAAAAGWGVASPLDGERTPLLVRSPPRRGN